VIISSSKAFDSDKLVLYASQKDDANLIQIEFDKLPGTFYGTGDAFAAMVIAWFTRLNDLKVSFVPFSTLDTFGGSCKRFVFQERL
jgi:pyridoxal/pyridoxine/pyridoxamine kinase